MSIDRIDVSNHGIGNNSPIERNADAAKKVSAGGASKVAKGEDSVALSAQARKFDQVADLAGNDRSKRLEQVKAAIDNGTYEVPGEQIARKMIAGHQK